MLRLSRPQWDRGSDFDGSRVQMQCACTCVRVCVWRADGRRLGLSLLGRQGCSIQNKLISRLKVLCQLLHYSISRLQDYVERGAVEVRDSRLSTYS